MLTVWSLVTPDAPASPETVRFNLETNPRLVYFIARLGDEPVARAFVEPWAEFAWGDVAVIPEHRRHGIGSALLAEISRLAIESGKGQPPGRGSRVDAEARAFLERRGFVQVGAEKALVLELDDLDTPRSLRRTESGSCRASRSPTVWRRCTPSRSREARTFRAESGVQSFGQWRAHEIDKPNRRPELCFLALAGDEVVGYAALQAFGEKAFHGLTVTRRDWRRRGVATALKCAEIAAAKERWLRAPVSRRARSETSRCGA